MSDLCDIFTSFKHVYNLSKFFAIFPFNIETSNGELKILSCKYSFLFTILTSIVVFVHGLTFPFYVVSSEVQCVFCLVKTTSHNGTEIETPLITGYEYQRIAMRVVNRFLVSLMSFSAIIFAFFYSSKLPAFLKKLDEDDFYFRALLLHSNRSVDCCISGRIIAGFGVICLPSLGYYMYTDLDGPDTTITSVIFLVILMWDNLISVVCDSQFINFVYLLNVRFQIINDYLNCFRINNLRTVGSNEYAHKSSNLNNSSEVEINIEDASESLGKSDLSEPSDQLLSLQVCRRCHRYLCNLLEDLNSMYQIVLLSTVSGCFLKMLFIVFAMVVGTTSKHSTGTFEEILKRIFWLNFYASRFLLVIMFAYETVQKAKHTKTIVSEICCIAQDKEINEELTLFYNQIKHRNIEFSACSLFTLSTDLITSAVAAGTTYLVILVQFHAPS